MVTGKQCWAILELLCHDTYRERVSRQSILLRDLIFHTIHLISCFCYCHLCCVSAIIHDVMSFYDELTDLLDRLAVLIGLHVLLILLLIQQQYQYQQTVVVVVVVMVVVVMVVVVAVVTVVVLVLSQILFSIRYKQLSQGRETARSLILFRLTSIIISKIMHKIGFLGHAIGASRTIYALYLNFLTQRNLLAEFYRQNVRFTRKTANQRF